MLFMTSYIFVTKPHEFHGDLVTGEEVANSKFFKLSEAWEKRQDFCLQYSSFWKSIALFEDSQVSPAGPSGRSR